MLLIQLFACATAAVLWIAIAVVAGAVALGSLQPALRAGGLDPLDALRRE